MNKAVIAARFERAIRTYHTASTVQRGVAKHLFDALGAHCPTPMRVLELGCGSGHLSRLIAADHRLKSLTLNDLSPKMEQCIGDLLCDRVRFISGDAETAQFDQKFDLIASASTVQWFENPTLFVARMATMLNPDGVLALSSFDTENLLEVSRFTGLTLPYPPLRSLLENQYEVLYEHQSQVTLHFCSAIEVLRHLRETGVNSLDLNPWSRDKFAKFCRYYNQKYRDENGVRLTYTPTYIVARKK